MVKTLQHGLLLLRRRHTDLSMVLLTLNTVFSLRRHLVNRCSNTYECVHHFT
jgi:hypothetical protein